MSAPPAPAGALRPVAAVGVQGTFDDLGTPLLDTTFVVVDLETTGGSTSEDCITEFGAVKMRGGEVLGEFQTLVRPGTAIPPLITALTGITEAMVADAPGVEAVLPAFLEFVGSRDTVLVAHNAGFDIGFLKAAARAVATPWPGYRVLDTVTLARQLIGRDEAPNHKLSSLALLFEARVTPDHRALHDARATVDVLHGLIARVGNLGVQSLEELMSFTSRVSPERRRKRVLAAGLPSAPGVYVFTDSGGRPLYVGTARDIRRRVRGYFTASEQRRGMNEMVGLAAGVTPIVCATALEAQVRELRLIAEHKPRYNRRSRHPERATWVKLTVEPFPRLSVVREVRSDGATYAGPFRSRSAAGEAVAAVHECLPLRQCTGRISARTTATGRACVLAEIGRCGAPCTGAQDVEEYASIVRRATALLSGDGREDVAGLRQRLRGLSDQARFEEAGTLRDRLLALVRGAARAQRLAPLAGTAELVAARRRDVGGWEVVCVRYGRLTGACLTPPGADPMPHIAALRATAEVVDPTGHVQPAPAALPEETEQVLRWLERPGTRLVSLDGSWTCPVGGAGGLRAELEPLARSWSASSSHTGRPGRST